MWQQLAVMSTSLYPALHRFHHTHYYASESNMDDVRDMAIIDGDRWWDYLDGQLDPFLSGAAPMAADFYLFMMTRWAPDRDRMLDWPAVACRFHRQHASSSDGGCCDPEPRPSFRQLMFIPHIGGMS